MEVREGREAEEEERTGEGEEKSGERRREGGKDPRGKVGGKEPGKGGTI